MARYYTIPEYYLRSHRIDMPGGRPNGIWETLKRLGSQRLPVETIALA
jgi:hypothetical protein